MNYLDLIFLDFSSVFINVSANFYEDKYDSQDSN